MHNKITLTLYQLVKINDFKVCKTLHMNEWKIDDLKTISKI